MSRESVGEEKQPRLGYPELRERLFGLITGYWTTQAVYVIAKLGVADHLAEQPLTATELAARIDCDLDLLSRFMRTVTSIGLFTRDAQDRYRLTQVSELLCSSNPHTMRPQAMMHAEEQYQAWGEVLAHMKGDGIAFEKRFGRAYFDYLNANPAAASTFNDAQAGYSASVAASVADAYDFGPYKSIVDVGGGYGVLLERILEKNPHIETVLFDQPTVVESYKNTEAYQRVKHRLTTRGGDFFAEVPVGGEIYILSLLIHDWDDERAQQILSNCRAAMPDNGRLLIVELVLPEDDEPFFGRWLDLHMAILLGARERTVAEFQTLLIRSGFTLDRTIQTPSGLTIVDATPIR